MREEILDYPWRTGLVRQSLDRMIPLLDRWERYLRSWGVTTIPPVGRRITRIGPRWPFFVSSAWTLLLVVGLAWLPSRLCRCPPRTHRRPLSAWVAFLRPASAVVLGSALLSSLELTLPVHLEEMLGATPEQTGLLLGMAAGPIASGVLKPALGFGLTLVTLGAAAALSLVFLAVPPAAPCDANELTSV